MAAELASADPQWDYAARITEVRARIVTAETVAGRHGAGVKLLVATKSWDAASAALRKAAAGRNTVKTIAAMNALREVVDTLELVLDDACWPLPKYREMLFIY